MMDGAFLFFFITYKPFSLFFTLRGPFFVGHDHDPLVHLYTLLGFALHDPIITYKNIFAST